MPCTKKGDKRDEAWGFPWLPPTSQRPGGVPKRRPSCPPLPRTQMTANGWNLTKEENLNN